MNLIRPCSVVNRKKMTNLLEALHFVNLGAISLALQYGDLCAVLTLSATFSLVLFVFTLIYHITSQIRENNFIHKKVKEKIQYLFFTAKLKSRKSNESDNVVTPSQTHGHPSTTYIELREELIESNANSA